MRLLNAIFPSWKYKYSKLVTLKKVCPLLKREWEEDAVLECQENRLGERRYFIVDSNGMRKPIDSAFVRAHEL